MTQQAAADRYGVPRMTVTDLVAEAQRLKLTADDLDPPPLPPAVTGDRVGRLPPKKMRKAGAPTALSEAEELALVQMILKHWRRGLSLNRVQIGVYVMRLVKDRKFKAADSWKQKGAPSGKWWKGFLARHKSIVALRKGDPLAHNRREVSRQQIDSFFSVLRALANNVWVVGLPPHSTHILQALDVKLMSPLKSNYSTALSLWLLKGNNAHVRMNPADFVDQGR